MSTQPTTLAKTTPIWRSRMFWLGVAQIGIGVAELVTQEVLDSSGAGWGAVASGAITIVLRYLTKQPVTMGGTPAKPVEAPTAIEAAEARSK